MPADGASEDLTLRIKVQQATASTDQFQLKASGVVTATDAAAGAPVSTFARKATITFHVKPDQGTEPNALQVYYWNTYTQVWVPLETTVDLSTGLVTATVDHLTEFAVMADTASLRPFLDSVPAVSETPVVTVSGRTVPGAAVQISRNNSFVASTTADEGGRFSADVSLADGRNRIFAMAQSGDLRRASTEVDIAYTAVSEPSPPVTPEPTVPPEKAPERTLVLTIDQQWLSVDGSEQMMDVAPYIAPDSGRTMVPVRFLSESLGALVEWLPETRQVRVTTANKTQEILLTIDTATALVNGAEQHLDAPAVIRNGRTMVPLRFISEKMGASVEWFPVTRQVVIKQGGKESQ